MGKPMDYGSTAPAYAAHRWALPWKLQPLLDAITCLSDDSAVLEVGCGTGDYLRALYDAAPHHHYHGFDISPEMLTQAHSRCPWASLAVANADVCFGRR
jgi:predicted TPR repeat methyltransferase